jgi:hypothetical protein
VNQRFLYKIILPFSKKQISFKELNTQNQLDIEKINLYYPSTLEYYLEFNNGFLRILEDCIENFEDFSKIDIFDYLLFCLKIRTISLGDRLELNIKSEDSNVKSKKINIDLQFLLKNILVAAEESLIHKIIDVKEKNLKIELCWPTLKSIKNFHNSYFSDMSFEDKILNLIPEFVSNVYIENSHINFKELDLDQKEDIFNTFPASLKTKIQNSILENIKKLSEFDLFQISYFENQKFNFFNLMYIDLIKLIFSQNPKRIYEEIYILSNFNMSSEYVLSMSPSERRIYISFIEAQRKSQEPTDQQSNVNIPQQNQSLQDLAVEFGDEPIN